MASNQRPDLTVPALRQEAATFGTAQTNIGDPNLFGVTDGKAIGTYIEHRFRDHLTARYAYAPGNSAEGIDFPNLEVDLKTTRITQPQSSCPYKSARQKIYGLGYSLLVFVYEKHDDEATRQGRLDIRHIVFVEARLTADYQTTNGIRNIIENDGNVDDLVGFMDERRLPLDEIEMEKLAQELLENPPALGYLTISNALQWRLQYGRVIQRAGEVNGIHRIR